MEEGDKGGEKKSMEDVCTVYCEESKRVCYQAELGLLQLLNREETIHCLCVMVSCD